MDLPGRLPGLFRYHMKNRSAGQLKHEGGGVYFWTTANQVFIVCVIQLSTLLYPVSLLIGCWDWVQGGDPLYAAVKCLSGCWGQIWRNFSIFFAKRTWHTHFLTGKFFSETKNNFFPSKLAVFRGSRHFSKIEGPFSEIEGPGFERMWPLLLLSLINNTNNY